MHRPTGLYRLHGHRKAPTYNLTLFTVPLFTVANGYSLLGPFYWAMAVLSVTRCRCCRCGHRFYIAIHQVSLLSHAACAIAIAWLRLILVVVSTVVAM